jgi:hypothetical protein
LTVKRASLALAAKDKMGNKVNTALLQNIKDTAAAYEKSATSAKMFESIVKTVNAAGPLEKGSVAA